MRVTGRSRAGVTLALLAAVAWFVVVERPAQAGARASAAGRAAPRAAAGTGLQVIPFPGTPDASPRSPVIFSSLSPPEVRSVRVTGSRSGLHHGRVKALPAGAGMAFVPRRPFVPGERVQVVAWLRGPTGGTASEAPSVRRLSFSFGVAIPVAPPASHHHPPSVRSVTGSPTRHFRSDPSLNPPAFRVSADPDARSGDIFLTPGLTDDGPMILNARGHLVWFDPVAPEHAYNLQVQSYQDQPVLTWWQGYPAEGVIANRSYQTVAVVRAADGAQADLHDFVLTPHGTAWLEATTTVQANLTRVNGPSHGELRDYLIQEVDIRTGQLLWQWDCYGHIPLRASYRSLPKKGGLWDAFHLNSVQVQPNGNLLVSVRHTWAVYEISRETGRILWTLGGRYNQFKIGRGAEFEWQHDAHRTGSRLTVFDDAIGPGQQVESQSSAKELDLNVSAKTATLTHRYTHAPPFLARAMGSTQILPNGNVFVGWGSEPDFSEYRPGGKQIFNGSFALGNNSYRAYRFPWTADPGTPPDMAVAPASNGGTNVWASWNGATNVAAWQVSGGSSPDSLQPLTTQPDHSFETRIALDSQPAYVEVQALNSEGEVLGTSSAQPVG